MDHYRTTEQIRLCDKMLSMRREYMESVETMFETFRPQIHKMFNAGQYQALIDFCYAVIPDCVPRTMTITSCINMIDEAEGHGINRVKINYEHAQKQLERADDDVAAWIKNNYSKQLAQATTLDETTAIKEAMRPVPDSVAKVMFFHKIITTERILGIPKADIGQTDGRSEQL